MNHHAVYKYPLVGARFHQVETLEIPEGAEFLSMNFQRGLIVLWFLVDTSRPPVERHFFLAATGVAYEVLSQEDTEYLGTLTEPATGLVLHVFEIAGEYA